MGGLGEAIKYLYEKFILRDLLSFITPGAIVILSALLLFLPGPCLSQQLETLFRYSVSFHWLLYIPIFGLFFLVGFAVQCFGRLLGCIRIHRIDRSTLGQRWGLFKCDWAKDPDFCWKAAQERVMDFLRAAADIPWAQQHHERLVVLKQMCANGSWAIGIAFLLLLLNGGINGWCTQVQYWLLIIAMLVLSLVLCWGYRVAELGMDTIERKILRDKGRLGINE